MSFDVGKAALGNPGRPRVFAHPRERMLGFSLLELLVVLLILSAVATLMVPAIRTGTGTELKAAAYTLATALRRTRYQAINQHRSEALVLDVERRLFSIAGEPKPRRLPAELEISLFTARSELLNEHAGTIRFFPDGSSNGGRITLATPDRKLLIDVDWLTGIVRVIDPAS